MDEKIPPTTTSRRRNAGGYQDNHTQDGDLEKELGIGTRLLTAIYIDVATTVQMADGARQAFQTLSPAQGD
jgi:hypothetical protein